MIYLPKQQIISGVYSIIRTLETTTTITVQSGFALCSACSGLDPMCATCNGNVYIPLFTGITVSGIYRAKIELKKNRKPEDVYFEGDALCIYRSSDFLPLVSSIVDISVFDIQYAVDNFYRTGIDQNRVYVVLKEKDRKIKRNSIS